MNRKVFFAALVLLAGLVTDAWAFEFTVANADGFPIKYTQKSDGTMRASKASSTTYSGTLVIPATVTYNGTTYTVTATDVFSNCGMSSVVIPSTVTYIGLFSNCANLASVSLSSSVTQIGNNAFKNCVNLTSITIPASVTSIGSNAFEGCSGLTSIIVPDPVTTLGTAAFLNCTGLTTAVIGNSVGTMPQNCFKGCTSLTSVSLGSGVTSIAGSAFQGCSSLTDIAIPEGVTTIGWSAFYNCSSLATVTLPESLTSMGGAVFCNCSSLTTITIPDNANISGDQVFYGCTSLTTAVLGSGVSAIYTSTFDGCSSLTSITIPASVTTISSSAFAGCTSLATVNYLGTPMQWLNINIANNNYGISNPVEQSHSISFNGELATHLEIPEGMTSIGANFRYVASLTHVVIPNSVTSIAAYAFDGCRLDSLTIGSGVTSIGSYAFRSDTLSYLNYNCTANILGAFVKTRLATVIIGDNVTTLPNSAFSGCSSLTSVVLPSGLTDIPSSAFNNCSSLSSITIPAGVASIGSSAFYNCSLLSSITIPASVTSIGSSAFYGCTGLTDVIFMGTPAQWLNMTINSNPVQYSQRLTFSNGELLTRLEIPEGATTVNANCRGISSLVSLVIPNSVTSIAAYAFDGCRLDSLTIGSGVTSIGSYAFRGDTLSYLNYNCSANILGAFVKTRLATVVIGDQITAIPNSAFYNCSSLTSVTIPGNVTSIGSSAFSGCSSLSSVNIPEGVTSIGSSMFKNCSALDSITIPASVTSISYYAFDGCTSLTMVNYTGSPEQWMGISFGSNPSNPIQYSHNLYFNGEPLTRLEFADTTTTINANFRYDTMLSHVVIPNSVTSIVPQAFEHCGLDSLTVGSGLTTIGYDAFRYDTISYLYYNNTTANVTGAIVKSGLTTVEIGDQVTAIPNNAFKNCTNLETLILHDGLVTIGGDAFRFCSSLVSLTLPASVDSIGGCAFEGCNSISSLVIPSGVDYIGLGAFNNWTALTSVVFNAENCNVPYIGRIFGGCDSITSFIFGDSVRVIPAAICQYMTGLTSVTIPGTVDSIGQGAFEGCDSLAETHWGGTAEGWMAIKIISSPIEYSRNLYLGDSLLTSVVIPSTVDTVNNNFRYDTTLHSIVFENGVTCIAENAFRDCGHISTVRIPNSVASIGRLAFGGDNIDSVFIGSGVTSMGSYVFGTVKYFNYNSNASLIWKQQHYDGLMNPTYVSSHSQVASDSLTTVVIGDSVTTIGTIPFRYCPSLTSVSIGSGVDSIMSYAFAGCGITSLVVPNNVSYIGPYAFTGCKDLASITLPDSLTEISKYLFANDSSLTSIIIPDAVTSIGTRAFEYCKRLESVNIPEGVSVIEDQTFNGCSSLRSITIPDSVYYIGVAAFSGCTSLDTLIVGSGLYDMGYGSFSGHDLSMGVFSGAHISHLDYNCGWYYDLPAKLSRDSLRTVVIGDDVTTIYDSAFVDSPVLSSVTMPANLWSIYTDAFAGCTALDSIVFPGTTPPYNVQCRATDAGNVVPFCYLNLIRIPCGTYSSYYNALHGNSTGYVVYDALNDQYLGWDTVLARILQESQIDLAFHALTADTSRGTAVVSYHGNWVSSEDYPRSADCADSSVVAKAEANYGYHFDHWSNGSTANPMTLHLAGDSSVTAFFAPNQYTVSLQSSNNSYGTISGDGSYTYLDTALIEATANTHYHFLRWNDGNTDNPRQIIVNGNISLTAQFVPDTHHVSVVANNAAYGTTTGTNDYAYGATVSVRANAAGGYYFVRWADGSTANPATFVCHGDTTMTAIFTPVVTPELCMVSVQDDRNVLLWDTEELPIVSYTVYREGTTSGQYEAVATIPYAEAGRWTDTASRPINRSYRYRLSATDTCGNESAKSGVHKTMHLTISQGVSGTWNLVWTAYEGADYSTYVIYRGTSAADIQQIDIMPSAGNTTYSDPDAPAGEVYYQVGVMMATPCGNGTKATTVSRSNIASSNNPGGGTEGIADLDADGISIYSVDGRIVVDGADGMAIHIYDMTGRGVQNRNLPSGVYMAKVGNYPARKVVVVR